MTQEAIALAAVAVFALGLCLGYVLGRVRARLDFEKKRRTIIDYGDLIQSVDPILTPLMQKAGAYRGYVVKRGK